MKTALSLGLGLLLALSACGAEPPRTPSPVIGADGVTFHLRAPEAREVAVRGQWTKDPLPLHKGDDGVWTSDAVAVPPGVWEYSLVVDGLAMIDPGNPAIKPMREPRTSILELPATPPQPWDFQDVPHGAVHQHSYLSTVLKRPRELVVYTPPGYETDLSAHYPVLVLQHGSGDNQQTWVTHGKAHWILDNLIAAGRARPMIVLMIDGHPLGWANLSEPAKRAEMLEAFRRELFEDALPLVESRYRTEPGREARAIAGLSMGGAQSLIVGLSNLDRFAWIGSFSGGVPDEFDVPGFHDSATANARLRLLWIGCGANDFLRARNEALIAKLKEKGLNFQWHLGEGGHEWPVWRRNLVEFAPLLFQPAGKTADR